MDQILVFLIIICRCLIWLLFNTENHTIVWGTEIYFSKQTQIIIPYYLEMATRDNWQIQWRHKEAGRHLLYFDTREKKAFVKSKKWS